MSSPPSKHTILSSFPCRNYISRTVMECRPLAITIASAKDLKDVNRLTTMDVYAVASIIGDPFGATQMQRTQVHKHSGLNPTWNFPMNFTLHDDFLEQNRLVLKIELISDRIFGDREIGEVHVRIKDLLDSQSDMSQFMETAYCVKIPSGESQGALSLTFKFGEKFNAPAEQKAQSSNFPARNPPPNYGGHNQPRRPYQPQYAGPPPQGHARCGYPAEPGFGHGLGVGVGLAGGLLVQEMISDVAEMAAYDADDCFDF